MRFAAYRWAIVRTDHGDECRGRKPAALMVTSPSVKVLKRRWAISHAPPTAVGGYRWPPLQLVKGTQTVSEVRAFNAPGAWWWL